MLSTNFSNAFRPVCQNYFRHNPRKVVDHVQSQGSPARKFLIGRTEKRKLTEFERFTVARQLWPAGDKDRESLGPVPLVSPSLFPEERPPLLVEVAGARQLVGHRPKPKRLRIARTVCPV